VVDGKSKGCFRDKGVTTHGLKGLTKLVRFSLIVSRHYPDLTRGLDTYLSGTWNMPCWVKRNLNPSLLYYFAVFSALDGDRSSQSMAKHRN